MALELNGTTGVSLVQDGVVTAADLAASVELGKFVSYAILWDEKGATTAGGTITAGSAQTRDLNQEVDPDGIVTLSSNQFTLNAGSYLITWSAPAYRCDRHGTRLRNVTDSTHTYGSSEIANATYNVGNRSTGSSRITIDSSKTFEVQHEVGVTKTTNGLGVDGNFQTSVFTIVEIFKEA